MKIGMINGAKPINNFLSTTHANRYKNYEY